MGVRAKPHAESNPFSIPMLLCGVMGPGNSGGGELHVMTYFPQLNKENSTCSPSHQQQKQNMCQIWSAKKLLAPCQTQ